MKKLLIASSILSALVMTGCASTKPAEQAEHAHPHADYHKHHGYGQGGDYHKHHSYSHGHGDYHKHHGYGKPMHKHEHGGTFEATYTCDHNTTFTAKYNPDEETSILNLKGSEITLKVAPSGSGVRFVGENGNTKYDWHTKGKMGILDVATGDKLQTFKCESKDFAMHDHSKYHAHGHHKHGHNPHGQKPHIEVPNLGTATATAE